MSNPATGNTLSIFTLLDALRRRKLFVVVPTLLLTAGFALFAYLQPNRYRGTALIAAEQTTPPEYLKHVAPAPLNIEEHLWTVRQVLFSEPVLEAAARELNQNKDAPGLSSAEIEEFKSHIDIKVESEHTFTIAYESPNRQGAMAVTNKLADLFVHYASASHEEKNKEAATVIDDQLDALKQRLTNQSKQLHAYKTQAVHALPDHIDDNIRAVDSLKAQNQERETKVAEEEARRASIQQELQALEAKGVLDQTVTRDKSPDELKLDDMRLKVKELESRYMPKHPEVIQAQRRLRDLEALVAAQPPVPRAEPSATYLRYVELQSELEGIEQRIKSYRRDQQQIAGEIAKYSERIEATPQHERAIEDMQREYQVGELQFHALLDKQLDAKLAKGFEESETYVAFAIVEPASLPTAPYSPQRARLVLMGIFAGLGLGLVTAFFLEQNDTTFGTVDDFQAFTTLPVIGVIPNVAGETRKQQRGRNERRLSSIVTATDPDSVAAEQYRVLAMKLQQQAEASHAKVVMITSAAGGEGKSLTGINLAIAFASIVEGKILLVDADMRKPRISEYLGMTVRPGKGFDSLLINPDADLEQFADKVEGIYVIAGNVPSGNPVAALASRKARLVFDRLKEEYSFIIVDAPPTLSIADSHLLNGLVDKVLFVVRARTTARELFQHAVESFDATNLLGVVLNDVDYQRTRYAYAYEYYKKNAA